MLPTLAAMRTHATEIAAEVLAENDGKWETASERDLERVDAIARAIVNRLLHEPTLRMKELRDDRVHARMALVRDLFGLNVEDRAGRVRGRRRPRSVERARPRRRCPRRARRRQPAELMRVGTRGSALALAQARVGRRAAAGDRRPGRDRRDHHLGDRGAAVADKSRWVSALERALLDGRIDIAVHSAKDVPGELADGLELVAIPRAGRSARRDLRRRRAARAGTRRPRRHAAACGAPLSSARCATDLEIVESARQRRHAAAQARRRRGRRARARAGRAAAARPRDAGRRRARPSSCRRPARARCGAGAAGAIDPRRAAAACDQRPGGDGVRDGRAGTRARLGATVQHAGRRPLPVASTAARRSTGWVGLPDGSDWLATS